MKNELKTLFNKLYKNCKLACIQLDGFSHCVFYIDENGYRKQDKYSAYATHYEKTERGEWNIERAKKLFNGYAHYMFQNNAKELVYMSAETFKKGL